MSYITTNKPLQLTTLTIAIGIANSSLIHASPVSLDDRVSENGPNRIVDLTGSKHATVEWDSFDLDAGDRVIFNQQGQDSVAINNIGGDSASTILGTIEANGHVFLVNSNGFTFGQGAVIDTQGFLATTFAVDFDTDQNILNISDNGSDGTITINNLEIVNGEGRDTQYVAFYSSDIGLLGPISDQSINENTHIELSTQPSGSIELPGLPIGFSLESDDITAGNLTISDSTDIISSQNGSVLLNSSNLNSLFNGNINLPDQISVKSIRIESDNEIKVSNQINAAEQGVLKDLAIISDSDISVENSVIGRDLELTIKGNNISVQESDNNAYSLLGGKNGLMGIDLTSSNTTTLSDSLYAQDYIRLNGNTIFSVSNVDQTSIDLRSDKEIFTDTIEFTTDHSLNFEVNSDSVVLGSITNSDSNLNQIDIITDVLSLSGDYEASTFNVQGLNSNIHQINLLDTTTLIINRVNLENPVFNIMNNNTGLFIGDSNNYLTNINIDNITMVTGSSAFKEFNLFIMGEKSFTLSGEFKTDEFSIFTDSSTSTLTFNNDLYISGLNTVALSNINLESSDYNLTLLGNNSITSSLSIANIDSNGVNISNFEELNLTGNAINTDSGPLNLMADNISLTKTDSDFSIESNSGKITINHSINANNNDITINSGTGGFFLSGISDSKSISLENSEFTASNKEHILEGDYEAISTINASNLGSVTLESIESVFMAENSIDFSGTQLVSNGIVNILSDTITTDDIHATKITISNINPDDFSSNLSLYGDLISAGDLILETANISLMDDIILEGNISFLKEKGFLNAEEKTGLLYSGTAVSPPSINGRQHLTLNELSDEAYLYEFGDTEQLSSLTLNGEGTLYMVDRPNISGARGLSILGNWDWSVGSDFEFSTNNQDLNLSGVNLIAEGLVSFDTGTGNLSLGSIGLNELVTEVNINSAGILNLHGNINLVGSTSGYNFSNTQSVILHTDMTFGSLDAPVIVDFGDATLDGTYTIDIFSDNLVLGRIGSNIALQELNISSNVDINLSEKINLVGSANINANKITLGEGITSSGLDINLSAIADIEMAKATKLSADFGNIKLISESGNIGLGSLYAKGSTTIEAQSGYVFNVIDDYISNDATSINITTGNLTLLGKQQVGDSISSPVVIEIIENGVINTESDGNIYIANLSNAGINSDSRITDSASTTDNTIVDAYSLFHLSAIDLPSEPTYKSTLGLIENGKWDLDEEENIKTIKAPAASPNLYYSRNGWRLGY